MTIYDQLLSEAYIKFKFLLGRYKKRRRPITMFGLLLGVGNYSVKANPDAPHNYQAVIDAVYKYYKKNGKDPDVVEYYEGGLEEAASPAGEIWIIQSAIEIFYYQMSNEKKGISPFKVDLHKIMTIFRESLKKDYEKIKSRKPDADEWLKKQSAMMKADYGYSFWDE